METLQWLQEWYRAQCDGEWEFREGIKILSVSNPGWSVEINVSDTILENQSIPYQALREGPADWHGYLIEDALFVGSGDPTKLEVILKVFQDLVLGKDRTLTPGT